LLCAIDGPDDGEQIRQALALIHRCLLEEVPISVYISQRAVVESVIHSVVDTGVFTRPLAAIYLGYFLDVPRDGFQKLGKAIPCRRPSRDLPAARVRGNLIERSVRHSLSVASRVHEDGRCVREQDSHEDRRSPKR
jgi:hypothetical protein